VNNKQAVLFVLTFWFFIAVPGYVLRDETWIDDHNFAVSEANKPVDPNAYANYLAEEKELVLSRFCEDHPTNKDCI